MSEFQHVTLNWCPDLTDPYAESQPLFFITYGEYENIRAAVIDSDQHLVEDEHDKKVVSGVLLRIAESLEKEGWGAFEWISDIRGNLYTSEVSPRANIEDPKDPHMIPVLLFQIVLEKSPLSDDSVLFTKIFTSANQSDYTEKEPCH
jgi:hypothetical protein